MEVARVTTKAVSTQLKKCLEEAQQYLLTASQPKLALVIDGKCLMYALDPSLRGMLLNLSLNCSSVVCCRVSPLQKAQVLFIQASYADLLSPIDFHLILNAGGSHCMLLVYEFINVHYYTSFSAASNEHTKPWRSIYDMLLFYFIYFIVLFIFIIFGMLMH